MELGKCNQVKELTNNDLMKDEYRIEVTICGTITSTIKISTKSDSYKLMYFITLENETGTIDCVSFDKQIKKFDKLLQTNRKVIIIGKKNLGQEDSLIFIQKVELAK